MNRQCGFTVRAGGRPVALKVQLSQMPRRTVLKEIKRLTCCTFTGTDRPAHNCQQRPLSSIANVRAFGERIVPNALVECSCRMFSSNVLFECSYQCSFTEFLEFTRRLLTGSSNNRMLTSLKCGRERIEWRSSGDRDKFGD